MIERLMNLEHPYEEPEYSKLSVQIRHLKQQLCEQLDQEGKGWLEQLTDTYLEHSAVLSESSFTDGFCAAVDLALGYLEHRTTTCSKAGQQQPPKP